MATIAFPDHSHTAKLSTGRTYTYVHIPQSDPAKSTLLFIHGFPSSSYDWRHQIAHFSKLGYGVIAPDTLGYGGSDKPTDPKEYTFKKLAADVVAVLDDAGLEEVHAVGHDFGAGIMSKVITYHSERLLSVTFVVVGFWTPAMEFDIVEINAMTTQMLGMPKCGHMVFLKELDAYKLVDAHKESFFTLIYNNDMKYVPTLLDPEALGAWLKEDRKCPVPDYFTPEEQAVRAKIFEQGGYQGPILYYNVLVNNIGREEEEKDELPGRIPVPVLFVEEKQIKEQVPNWSIESTKPYAPDMIVKSASTWGHWVPLEVKDELNGFIQEFVENLDKEE